MDIKTKFNIGDEVYTVDYVGVAGKPYCKYVVAKEKYRVDGIKINVVSYGEKIETTVDYWNDKHTRYLIAFATKKEAQAYCDRRI